MMHRTLNFNKNEYLIIGGRATIKFWVVNLLIASIAISLSVDLETVCKIVQIADNVFTSRFLTIL